MRMAISPRLAINTRLNKAQLPNGFAEYWTLTILHFAQRVAMIGPDRIHDNHTAGRSVRTMFRNTDDKLVLAFRCSKPQNNFR